MKLETCEKAHDLFARKVHISKQIEVLERIIKETGIEETIVIYSTDDEVSNEVVSLDIDLVTPCFSQLLNTLTYELSVVYGKIGKLK